jgi:hypothetical protein
MPSASTEVSEGTIAATETPRASTSPRASSARAFVPCGLRVVLEAKRRRYEEVVRDTRARRDVAVGVDRDRLHRRRSDVDSDGELRHGGRH